MLETLLCLVIAVADGDTLSVRCGEQGRYEQVSVRLVEIDAPEKGQAFGQRSKEALSSLCFGVQASVTPVTRDRYGRTVARVECRGLDASAEQIRRGMAWRFVRYSTDATIQPLEDAARSARTGLWADAAPVPPWEWRATRRAAQIVPAAN